MPYIAVIYLMGVVLIAGTDGRFGRDLTVNKCGGWLSRREWVVLIISANQQLTI